MSDPISFDSTSPRLGLPLLFAGQAQKEVFVNEALVRIDALAHCIVEGELAVPPTGAQDGQSWLVAASPAGAWAGKSGKIAFRQLGQWLFAEPADGLRITNRATGQIVRRLNGNWLKPATPAAPTGGTSVDSEARAALVSLIAKLVEAGIFPQA